MRSYQYKTEDWLRRLNALQAENARLKNALANSVQNVLTTDILVRAENLQTQLLNRDVAISLLRNELSSAPGNFYEGTYLQEEIKRIESGIEEMEKRAQELKQILNTGLNKD